MSAILRTVFKDESTLHERMSEDLDLEIHPILDSDVPQGSVTVSNEHDLQLQYKEAVEFLEEQGEILEQILNDVESWYLDFSYFWYYQKLAYAS